MLHIDDFLFKPVSPVRKDFRGKIQETDVTSMGGSNKRAPCAVSL